MRAIVFSRDRPAQLDLLLRSLERNAGELRLDVVVLYLATGPLFDRGYEDVVREHPEARLVAEDGLSYQVRALVPVDELVVFFTDDDVLVRPVDGRALELLDRRTVLTLSLRLGRNTTTCYPHRRAQRLPRFSKAAGDLVSWHWKGADGDFGYPLSLDGHVLRGHDVLALLRGRHFSNPNALEGLLARDAERLEARFLMAAYPASRLVSVPANRVTVTDGNRYGETFPADPVELVSGYLLGRRLDLDALDPELVDGAHAELPLTWEAA